MTTPVGYRIHFRPDIAVPGANYGSGRYGSGLYGQKVSDALTSRRFRAVPYSGGANPMADPDITVVRGDSLPTLTVQFLGDNDQPLVLDDLDTQVYFHLRPVDAGDDEVRTGGCAIVSEAQGIVNYDWPADITVLAGEYAGEFEVVYVSGRRLTIPTIGKLRLHVPDDIGPRPI